jgi:hypothetical protein
MIKIRNILVLATLLFPLFGCEAGKQGIAEAETQRLVEVEAEKKRLAEVEAEKKRIADAKVSNYEGLQLGMKKADALTYISYDKIYSEYQGSLRLTDSEVTKNNAFEKGIPQNFFKLEKHVPLGSKKFDLLQLSFTSTDEMLWKITISYIKPKKKDDEIALRAAVKAKFKVNELGRSYFMENELITVTLLDEKLTKEHLEHKSQGYLSEL